MEEQLINIIYIIWMWLLPALGIMLSVLVPIVWIFIIPKISKKLMWARFRNSNIIALASDSGWVDLVITTKTLPEGIHQTKEHGWRFQLRPRWSKDPKTTTQESVEQLASRKYFLKDLGKPFWFAYDGKIPLLNPPSLAALQQNPIQSNPTPDMLVSKICEFTQTMPEHLATPLKTLVEELKQNLEDKARSFTILDPKIIKEVFASMITPSQIDALATNREQYGALKKGRDLSKLVISGMLIIGLVAVIVAALYFLTK